MFKSFLRFVGLGLFLVITSGNVLAGTLSSSDPCYNKTFKGPKNTNISCNNYDDDMGKCYQVSAGTCEYWCKQPNSVRLAHRGDNNSYIASASDLDNNAYWFCRIIGSSSATIFPTNGSYSVTSSSVNCSNNYDGGGNGARTSYDGQTYYRNRSYTNCELSYIIRDSSAHVSGYGSGILKLNSSKTYGGNYPDGFDMVANKPFTVNYIAPTDWLYDSRSYSCSSGYHVKSDFQGCVKSGGAIGCKSGSSCVTCDTDSYCSACTGNTFSDTDNSSTSCYNPPRNATVTSDHTDYYCNAGYYESHTVDIGGEAAMATIGVPNNKIINNRFCVLCPLYFSDGSVWNIVYAIREENVYMSSGGTIDWDHYGVIQGTSDAGATSVTGCHTPRTTFTDDNGNMYAQSSCDWNGSESSSYEDMYFEDDSSCRNMWNAFMCDSVVSNSGCSGVNCTSMRENCLSIFSSDRNGMNFSWGTIVDMLLFDYLYKGDFNNGNSCIMGIDM